MAWDLLHAGVLWIHVVCMAFWMGSMIFGLVLGGSGRVQAALVANAGTAPMLRRLPVAFGVAVPAGVVSGILMGTVFGPVRGLTTLLTPYGLTMSVALVLVLATLAFGPPSPDEKPGWWVGRWHIREAGIMGAFTCMMLMRFGI